MVLMRFRAIVFPILTVVTILGISTALIAYGRGYRVDFTKTSLKSTGLVAATSDPVGAQVFVDGKLKTATNNSFNLDPGWYTVSIAKEGYISWEKKLRMQTEIVSRADAFLFPSNPSLSPLTVTGIEQPIFSPDGTRIAYTIPMPKDENGDPKKSGLWYFELIERGLGRNRDPRLVAQSTNVFNLTGAQIRWSPDSRQLMAFNGREVRLYDLDRPDTFTSATSTYKNILSEWEADRVEKERTKLAAFKQPIIDIATKSAKIIAFSPDETKILYEATSAAKLPAILVPALIGTNPTAEQRNLEPGKYYVYDSKEDKNYFVLDPKELPVSPTIAIKPIPKPKTTSVKTPTPPTISIKDEESAPLHWFPTSRHLVLTIPGKIDIMEYDRTNWITVYSGPFVEGFIAPWPNGSRIIILTNFNEKAGSLPNLYTVNLR